MQFYIVVEEDYEGELDEVDLDEELEDAVFFLDEYEDWEFDEVDYEEDYEDMY